MESIHTCPWPQLCTDSDANTGWSNGRKSINSRRRSHFRESTCPEGNNIWAGINVACCFSLLVVKGCNFFRRVRAILPTPEAMNCSHARNGMQGASWRNSYNRIWIRSIWSWCWKVNLRPKITSLLLSDGNWELVKKKTIVQLASWILHQWQDQKILYLTARGPGI